MTSQLLPPPYTRSVWGGVREADGGVMGNSGDASDPSAREDAGTSPAEAGEEKIRFKAIAGRR